jgi:hypothetical protein
MRSKMDPHKKAAAMDRVAARLAALPNYPASTQACRGLFKLWSTFVHGRARLQRVSTLVRIPDHALPLMSVNSAMLA